MEKVLTPPFSSRFCLRDRAKKAKSSKSVYFDQFLEIECSYLFPNELDDKYLSRNNSEFVAFHNNVRTANKHENIGEILTHHISKSNDAIQLPSK